MSDVAIRVEGLGKAYRLGVKTEKPETLVQAAAGLIRAPLENFRRLRRLDTFSSDRDSDDILWALRDVSFEIKEGEVVGFVGHNGAGKSTLLKILSRIAEPTTGRAVIRGRVSSLLEVGTGFHPELSGRENVYMNGTILGMKRAEIDRVFEEIVDFSGVERFLDTPVKRYSSGMKVRLAFAVAAHLEPEILIIDEVLAVGDAEFQAKCLGKMEGVASSGRTVLFVSHNMGAIQTLCSRAISLKAGGLVEDGVPRHVIDSYLASEAQDSQHRLLSSQVAELGEKSEVALVSVAIEASDGKIIDTLISGSPIVIRVKAETRTALSDLRVSASIRTDDGVRVTRLDSSLTGQQINTLIGPSEFACSITEFPLAVGTYWLSLWFSEAGRLICNYANVLKFAVVGSSIFPAGKTPPINSGVIYLKQEWGISLDDHRKS